MPKKGAPERAAATSARPSLNCALAACTRKVGPPDEDGNPTPFCTSHGDTYDAGFDYMAKADVIMQYNSKDPKSVAFHSTFDRVDKIVHGEENKTDVLEGQVGHKWDRYREVGRDYGSYTLSDPLPLL